jgi:rRNA-processing protein FCF1
MAKSSPFIDETIQFTHTDDVLHAISLQRRWPILTVDTKLKKRLSESGLPWIEVKGKKHLAMIETYGSVNKSSSP